MDFLTWRLKGWRTWIANSLMAIMPILQLSEVTAVMPPAWLPWYALVIVLVNMWLRKITTSPLGKKF